MIKQIQKEQNEVKTEIESLMSAEPASKKPKEDEQRGCEFQNVIAYRNHMITLDFIPSIVHNFSLQIFVIYI